MEKAKKTYILLVYKRYFDSLTFLGIIRIHGNNGEQIHEKMASPSAVPFFLYANCTRLNGKLENLLFHN